MEQQTLSQAPRWEAKVSTSLAHASPEQIWPLFSDFFSLNKWLPGLSTCYGISGDNGEIGCVRFCQGSLVFKDGAPSVDIWAKERLTSIDHIERTLSYEIFENNKGFNSYVATYKVGRVDDDSQGGCLIEWAFGVEPVDGWKLDDLIKSYEFLLQCMGKQMEDYVMSHNH